MAGRSYDGKGIRVLWRAERCIHSGTKPLCDGSHNEAPTW